MGITYRLMECYEEALKNFDRAIELDPKLAWAIACRGETYLMLKRYNEALADFNSAIDLDSNNDWYLCCRALAYQALNQADKAQADLDLAIQLAQQSYEKDAKKWNNTFNLAVYYLAAGAIEQSKTLYREALSNDVPLELIREALRDLDNFLTVFPDHIEAKSMQRLLQSARIPFC